MSVIMLGIGDSGASKTPGDVVKTMALGSCVGIVLLYPGNKTVGMVHVALPESKISLERAKERPGYFADTGLPLLFKQMMALGCGKEARGYVVKLVGGAQVMDAQGAFNIGKRNILAIKKLLWRHGMGPVAEDIGGSISRTVAVEVDTGRLIITSAGRGSWEI
ncbi:MAG: chemotaxis protein CheD [Pseudomonadota bacterium]